MITSPVGPSVPDDASRTASATSPRGLSRRVVLGGAATAAVGVSATAVVTALSRRGVTPDWDAATEWLNSKPFTSGDLDGLVVLVDFWTFTCINWIRTAPYRRAWWRDYRSHGLVVIGVHTPEFSFEHDVERVRREARVREIAYPVVVDNDYRIWRSFDNHYWPALYLLDHEGKLRHRHFGEGGYEETERQLQRLLGVEREPVMVRGHGVEAEADWGTLRSPETYLGYGRGTRPASSPGAESDKPVSYETPAALGLNEWALSGEWTVGREKVELNRAGGRLSHRFHARDAHLVLSSTSRRPISFRVLLDGQVPGPSHGDDVAADGSGTLHDGRLYHLIRVADSVHDRTLDITFSQPDAEAYAFTFG